jgi:dienelactone hydrolase
MQWFFCLATLTMGCSGGKDTGQIEPIVAPDDPAARGVPVGVATYSHAGVTFEVWYPASDAVSGEAVEAADFGQFIPQSFTDHVGEVTLPSPSTGAVRDAAVRETGERLPVVLFSHGFGGFRLQSYDLTVHLASRGYIVVAPDHPGRMMGDVLPCLFSPQLDGCDLTGFIEDPALEGLPVVLDWLGEGEGALSGRVDLDRIGLVGHSAGGSSTTTFGGEDDRIDVLVPMAGGGAVSRDVPALFMDGSCDGIVSPASTQAAATGSTDAVHARLEGAGHLAFADLCALELDALAAEHLSGRDDLNATFYDQLLALGVDGCPGAAPLVDDLSCEGGFLELEISAEIVRALVTQQLDLHLRGKGGDLNVDAYRAVTLTP